MMNLSRDYRSIIEGLQVGPRKGKVWKTCKSLFQGALLIDFMHRLKMWGSKMNKYRKVKTIRKQVK